MTWPAHTPEISLGGQKRQILAFIPPTERGNKGAGEEKGGKNDHNEAFKLLRLDTMQETLVVTLRNPSRSFPREAQCHRVTDAGQTYRNRALTLALH